MAIEASRPPPSESRRNLTAVAWTSLLTDVSSEMVLNLLPLYLSAVLGVKTSVIGLVEGLAESVSSLVKVVSGVWSDRLGRRKPLAVAGYGLSACSKALLLLAQTWPAVAALRWADRVGKGLRTAPRDALLADSAGADRRGFAFGLHRAADTLGAAIGIGGALLVVYLMQGGSPTLEAQTFEALVWAAILPGFAAVAVLALGAREVASAESSGSPRRAPSPFSREAWSGLGRPFFGFLAIAALFDLGNSSDAFLVLRAAERGAGTLTVLAMLLVFNLVYAISALPAGRLSDRFGRRGMLVAGWGLYALLYLGFARAESQNEVFVLYATYGLYYGLTMGSAKALIADLVPAAKRGTAFGLFAAVLAFCDLPASVLAGILWQGAFGFAGFGPAAPFYLGAVLAALASLLLFALPLSPKAAPG
jgi:MFS family permease